jgi:hypothetical protein
MRNQPWLKYYDKAVRYALAPYPERTLKLGYHYETSTI